MTKETASAGARPPRFRQGIAAGLLLLAAAGAAFWQVWRIAEPDAAVQEAKREAQRQDELRRSVGEFLNGDAKELLNAAQKKDMAAVQRALDSLSARFQTYAGGIDKFTNALTGWGMRSKIIYRSAVETIERKDVHSWTAALVKEKFTEHVLSDAGLEADVMEILKQFAYDTDANRNELLASLETGLATAHLPGGMRQVVLQDFRERTKARIQELLQKLPGQSVAVGVGSITAGIVAEEAVRQLIRAVIAQAATRIAAGAAVSGGAAAGAAAGGGAGGTAVAPGIGTVVGFAGGLIVGAVVDWWLTDEFKEKVAAQCRQFLITTQVALVTGDKGLEKLLLEHVTTSNHACREAVTLTLNAATGAPTSHQP